LSRRLPALLAVSLGLLVASPARAGEEVERALRAWTEAADAQGRGAAAFALAALDPEGRETLRAWPTLRRWPEDVQRGEPFSWKEEVEGVGEHTVFAFAPRTYEPGHAWPVLVWLHGAVSRPADGGGRSVLGQWARLADQEEFILLAPSARRGSEWWTPAGERLVLQALSTLCARYRVDADRVALGGFSDGASGCWSLLVRQPGPFCCFLSLMGHPVVARRAGGPAFAANLGARPVYAVNGGRDALYPSAAVRPFFEEMRREGCDVVWEDLPEAGHDVAQATELWPRLREFWVAHPRQALRRELRWQAVAGRGAGALDWIEIESVSPDGPPALGAGGGVLPAGPGRPRIGLSLDAAWRGPGVRVSAVEEGGPASAAGVRPGDVLLAVGGSTLPEEGAGSALLALLARRGAEPSVYRLRREDAEVEVTITPRLSEDGLPEGAEALGYGAPTGRVVARVREDGAIEIECRGVERLRLHLCDALLPASGPLRVFVNGEIRHDGPAPRSVAYFLSRQAGRGDGEPPWTGTLLVRP